MRPQGLHHYRVEKADFGVELTDVNGQGIYQIAYITFDKDGKPYTHWKTAQGGLDREQRKTLWPEIAATTEWLINAANVERIGRKIPHDCVKHWRTLWLDQVITNHGYHTVREWSDDKYTYRIHRKN